MRLDEEYCLSEYVDLGRLGDNEKVHIVRNQVNGVIGVRKYVALDLEEIYLFLKENPNFEMDAMKNPHITGEMALRAKTGFIELFPDTDNSDGFFVCRLKKLR